MRIWLFFAFIATTVAVIIQTGCSPDKVPISESDWTKAELDRLFLNVRERSGQEQLHALRNLQDFGSRASPLIPRLLELVSEQSTERMKTVNGVIRWRVASEITKNEVLWPVLQDISGWDRDLLRAQLQHPDPRVRVFAVLAAGQWISRRDQDHTDFFLPALTGVIYDSNEDVAIVAACELGTRSETDSKIQWDQRSLPEFLRDRTSSGCLQIFWALHHKGHALSHDQFVQAAGGQGRAAEALTAGLAHEDDEVRNWTIAHSVEFAPANTTIIEKLVALLDHSESEIAARNAILQAGVLSIPQLIQGLKSDNPRVRIRSAWLLGTFSNPRSDVNQALAQGLKDPRNNFWASSEFDMRQVPGAPFREPMSEYVFFDMNDATAVFYARIVLESALARHKE